MLCVRKNSKIATSISEPLYDTLKEITTEKNISISEFVIMAVSMHFNRQNIKAEQGEKMPRYKKIITVRVSKGLFDMVDKASKKCGCSRSKFLFDAIECGLDYVKKG